MSEATQMRIIALGMLVGAVLFGALFVASGFDIVMMLLPIAFLVGAFMAFLLSFAA